MTPAEVERLNEIEACWEAHVGPGGRLNAEATAWLFAIARRAQAAEDAVHKIMQDYLPERDRDQAIREAGQREAATECVNAIKETFLHNPIVDDEGNASAVDFREARDAITARFALDRHGLALTQRVARECIEVIEDSGGSSKHAVRAIRERFGLEGNR